MWFIVGKIGQATQSYIEGLNLSPSGVVKEFPELEGKPISEIKREGIKRFKEKIKNMKTVYEIRDYLISDLKKYGYEPYMWRRKGHRPVRIKNGNS